MYAVYVVTSYVCESVGVCVCGACMCLIVFIYWSFTDVPCNLYKHISINIIIDWFLFVYFCYFLLFGIYCISMDSTHVPVHTMPYRLEFLCKKKTKKKNHTETVTNTNSVNIFDRKFCTAIITTTPHSSAKRISIYFTNAYMC